MKLMSIRIFALHWLFGLINLSGMPSGVAQTVGANTGTATATASVQPVNSASLAVIDEPFALYESLIRELRNGGYVLYMRHGAVIATTTDKRIPGAPWWRDCANTQRLGPEAQPRARAIAEAITLQRINIFEIHSSEFCRAFDTATHFGLMPARRTPALNDASALPDQQPQSLMRYAESIQLLLAAPIPTKVNRVLVGHQLPANLVHPALNNLPEGHVAIFKVDTGSRFHFITTLSPGQWQWLGKQMVADQAGPTANPQVPQPVAVPAPQVLIAPEKELKGIALVQALRRGGFNLYMRHAQSTVGQDGNLLQTPFWWENCAIQRNISDSGKEQAKKVGDALKTLKIPVEQILTAQFCRTRDTGHLMGLGPIEVTEDINHQIGQRAGFDVNVARFKRLAEIPAAGTNTLLVSHTHGSPRVEERIMGGIQEAEIVVYQPDGQGGSEPVARIPVPEWETLIKASVAIPAATAPAKAAGKKS